MPYNVFSTCFPAAPSLLELLLVLLATFFFFFFFFFSSNLLCGGSFDPMVHILCTLWYVCGYSGYRMVWDSPRVGFEGSYVGCRLATDVSRGGDISSECRITCGMWGRESVYVCIRSGPCCLYMGLCMGESVG